MTGKCLSGTQGRSLAGPRWLPPRTSKFLKHFTGIADDCDAWKVNYKEEEEEEEQPPPTPTWGEEGRTADPNTAPASPPKRPLDFGATSRKLFGSHRFQAIVICRVVLDAAVLVLAGLLPDLKIGQPDKNNYAARALHYPSIAILTFMMEMAFKIFVFCLEFFHHKFEIPDTTIVVVLFVVDIILLLREHEFGALGLLLLPPLRCEARIINGTIILVKTRSQRQQLRLKPMNTQLAPKIQHLEFSCSEKERQMERLNKLLATAQTA